MLLTGYSKQMNNNIDDENHIPFINDIANSCLKYIWT